MITRTETGVRPVAIRADVEFAQNVKAKGVQTPFVDDRNRVNDVAGAFGNFCTVLIPFLATTGSAAPFVGLFGTVWGIMNSFRAIGAKGAANLSTVAPGIAEALIATAIGLVAAIPAVMAYNYFTRRVKVLSSEMESFSNDFLNIVRRHFLR